MNMFDIIIIIVLLIGFINGKRNGFSKQLISTVGLLIVIGIAYIFKNPISTLMYKYLPFINIGGKFEGVTVITIILYEFIAFLIIFSILLTVFQILVKTSSKIEGVITKIPIVGLPSKLLGGLLGIIEMYIVVFLVLLFLSMPMVSKKHLGESKLNSLILEHTPVLSNYTEDTRKMYDEVFEISNKYKKEKDKTGMNKEILKKLIEYKFITKENVDYLISTGKIEYTEE